MSLSTYLFLLHDHHYKYSRKLFLLLQTFTNLHFSIQIDVCNKKKSCLHLQVQSKKETNLSDSDFLTIRELSWQNSFFQLYTNDKYSRKTTLYRYIINQSLEIVGYQVWKCKNKTSLYFSSSSCEWANVQLAPRGQLPLAVKSRHMLVL